MTMIRRTFTVTASPDDVWDVLRDIGAVHTRLAPGFVADTVVLAPDKRRVTFANGAIVTEQIVSLDDDERRLAYTILERAAEHHHASFEVLPHEDGATVIWTTDVLRGPVAETFRATMVAAVPVIATSLENRVMAH
jgi:polyketide cyclase/dehydrase/lipid transport protein